MVHCTLRHLSLCALSCSRGNGQFGLGSVLLGPPISYQKSNETLLYSYALPSARLLKGHLSDQTPRSERAAHSNSRRAAWHHMSRSPTSNPPSLHYQHPNVVACLPTPFLLPALYHRRHGRLRHINPQRGTAAGATAIHLCDRPGPRCRRAIVTKVPVEYANSHHTILRWRCRHHRPCRRGCSRSSTTSSERATIRNAYGHDTHTVLNTERKKRP